MKKWRGKLQKQYTDFEDFFYWARLWNLHKRLGYTSIRSCWNDNPMIEGSVNPADYRRIDAQDAQTQTEGSAVDSTAIPMPDK